MTAIALQDQVVMAPAVTAVGQEPVIMPVEALEVTVTVLGVMVAVIVDLISVAPTMKVAMQEVILTKAIKERGAAMVVDLMEVQY